MRLDSITGIVISTWLLVSLISGFVFYCLMEGVEGHRKTPAQRMVENPSAEDD